jgi:hypothetical protein
VISTLFEDGVSLEGMVFLRGGGGIESYIHDTVRKSKEDVSR